MRIDRRFWIVVTLSLFWALLVSSVFYRLARGPEAAAGHSRNQKVLVVASRPLPLGDTITRDSVHTRNVPEDLFPKGGFSKVEDVLDRPVISPILPDEPVMETRVAARGAGLGLAPMIPDGMRAIAVRVNDVVGVAGFILPGMHVDVLSTGSVPGRSDTVTRTVLENITVLSAGQTIQVDAKSQAINAAVVTLLVSPTQAEALALANSEGRIQLALRNSTDAQTSHSPGRQLRELYAESRESLPEPQAAFTRLPVTPAVHTRTQPASVLPRMPVPVAPSPDASQSMVVIRGSKKSVEIFPTTGTRP